MSGDFIATTGWEIIGGMSWELARSGGPCRGWGLTGGCLGRGAVNQNV